MFKKFKRWARSADWNRIAQEVCAVLIGIGLGLYGYESKVALLPLKWKLDREVAQDIQKEQPKQSTKTEPKEKKKETESESGGLEGLFSGEVEKFWKQTGVDRYVAYAEQYSKEIEDMGLRGALGEDVKKLMEEGVETVPKKWTSEENRLFFIMAIILLVASLSLKMGIHFSLINCNRLRNKIFHIRIKPGKKRIDWNGILQEIGTLGISAIGGLYLQPALEEILKGESNSFPYPFVVMSIFMGCLLLKTAVSSTFLDLNARIYSRGKYPLFSFKRFRRFSRANDWNSFTQQICTIIVSLGLGFYAYESNLALLPLKWKTDGKVAQNVSEKPQPQKPTPVEKKKKDGWGKWLGIDKELNQIEKEVEKTLQEVGAERLAKYSKEYTEAFESIGVRGKLRNKVEKLIEEGVDPVPKKWTEPQNRPYLIAALLIFCGSFSLKFLIYFYVIDMNALIKKEKRRTSRKKVKRKIDWQEIIEEMTTIMLGTLIGLYVEPLMDMLADKPETSFPYPHLGPTLILVCLTIKLLIYFEIISIAGQSRQSNNRPRNVKRPGRQRRRPGR